MVSAQKRAANRLQRAYLAFRIGQLERRTGCEAVDLLVAAIEMTGDDPAPVRAACLGRSTLLHHRRFRSQGGAVVSQINTTAACDRCHEWIHAHPMLAHMAGLIVRQGDAEWAACGVSEA